MNAFNGDTAELIVRMRAGTPVQVVAVLAKRLGIKQKELLDLLRLPKNLLKRSISASGKLSGTEQDRFYRVEKVWMHAVHVLEDEEAAKTWLVRTNRTLGGEMPLALLDTQPGYELVLDTLSCIRYGTVS